MTTPARAERLALCDLFVERGADAPTLCEGWDAADLAAHLVVREHNPLAGAGILLSPLAGYTEGAMRKVRQRRGFDGMVRTIRSGPPLGPFRWFESQMNLNEYFVHHEDLRRGDGTTGPRPEADTEEVDRALWDALRRGGKLLTRGLKNTGVVLSWPGHGSLHPRDGEHVVTLTGTPGEIVLFLNGRKDASRVELGGDDDAVARASDADLGI